MYTQIHVPVALDNHVKSKSTFLTPKANMYENQTPHDECDHERVGRGVPLFKRADRLTGVPATFSVTDPKLFP